MTSRNVQFYHVDDERDRVDWIPDCMRTLFYNIYPQRWAEAAELEEVTADNRQDYRFNLLLPDGGEIKVTYTLVDHECVLGPDENFADGIFILDLMRMEGARLELVGDKAYKFLLDQKVPVDHIYVLTGYEDRSPEEIQSGLPESNRLNKPVDPEILAETLLRAAKVLP
jgi:hypothetical protein